MANIRFTDYLRYRAKLRDFSLEAIAEILSFSGERYYDLETDRYIAVGRADHQLLMIPYEIEGEMLIPITVHATTRQQIKFRVTTGRFRANG